MCNVNADSSLKTVKTVTELTNSIKRESTFPDDDLGSVTVNCFHPTSDKLGWGTYKAEVVRPCDKSDKEAV